MPVPLCLRHALLIVSVLAAAATCLSADEPDTREPSADVEAMLKRFVDECVAITPGENGFPTEFQIGQQSPQLCEQPVRQAVITHDFRICRYETTQELYLAVVGSNPSRWKGPRNSVETVSWQDSVRFCQRLTVLLKTRQLIQPNEEVRLPTEMEWEYCCRAGTSSRYSFGEDVGSAELDQSQLNQFAWSTHNAAGNDPAVGVLKPNPWGLYDMHGYLWEYVSDSWMTVSDSESSAGTETAIPVRVMRGGSWRDHAALLSSASRLPIPEYTAGDAVGFRCVIGVTPSAKNPSKQ